MPSTASSKPRCCLPGSSRRYRLISTRSSARIVSQLWRITSACPTFEAASRRLRCTPTATLTFPHAVTQEGMYLGYRIPKGATVINHAYAIQMDPQRHPDPIQYNPDRYNDDIASLTESAASADATKRDQFTFGTGRRICQGIVGTLQCRILGLRL